MRTMVQLDLKATASDPGPAVSGFSSFLFCDAVKDVVGDPASKSKSEGTKFDSASMLQCAALLCSCSRFLDRLCNRLHKFADRTDSPSVTEKLGQPVSERH